MLLDRKMRATLAALLFAGSALAGCTSSEAVPPDPAPDASPAPPDATRYSLRPPSGPEGLTLALTRMGADPIAEWSLGVAAGEEVSLLAIPGETLVATWVGAAGPPWTTWLDPECSAEATRGAYGQRVLHVPQEYGTIQAAIDAAAPGETVRVAPGIYGEHVRLRSGVRLVGTGAHQTVLDGGGAPEPLVDFSGTRDVVVAGFTFRNVGRATGCGMPDDPFLCSGDWYAPAVYGDGHDPAGWPAPCSTSAVIVHNVFEQNHIGLLAYFHARVVVRNNLFRSNAFGLVANHFQDAAVVESNVFWENERLAIGSQAATLAIVDNVVARSAVGIEHEYVQTGPIRCNLFFENGANGGSGVPRFSIGQDGNVEVDAGFVDAGAGDFHLRAGSAARDAGCFPGASSDPDGSRRDIGAYGGPLATWTEG